MILQHFPQKKAEIFLCLTDAEFVLMTCFGCWNTLEDLVQVEAFYVLVDLAWPLVLLPSAMGRLNLGHSWFQNEKHVEKTLT